MFQPMALLFIGVLCASAAMPARAEAAGGTIHSVPVMDEPLHVVRHRGAAFIVYTNWIEPGVWTQYHQHRNDLLAVIPAATTAASQEAGGEPREQSAPAGTLVLFPYADSDAPFVHRVGGSGKSPFINIGLEFQDAITASCPDSLAAWGGANVEALAPNRRGQGYRLRLEGGAEAALPKQGRGLLIVPLGTARLAVDEAPWNARLGDFRFYDGAFPGSLRNPGAQTVNLVVFSAC